MRRRRRGSQVNGGEVVSRWNQIPRKRKSLTWRRRRKMRGHPDNASRPKRLPQVGCVCVLIHLRVLACSCSWIGVESGGCLQILQSQFDRCKPYTLSEMLLLRCCFHDTAHCIKAHMQDFVRDKELIRTHPRPLNLVLDTLD